MFHICLGGKDYSNSGSDYADSVVSGEDESGSDYNR
jgi:hypothetical protein